MSQVRRWLPWARTAEAVHYGGTFSVFVIRHRLAVKCATVRYISDISDIERNSRNRECLDQEMRTVLSLMNHPHPNIIKTYWVLPDAIIMEYAPTTIEIRLINARSRPIESITRSRWECQLVDALAWLEGRNLVHGSLRADVVLLSASEDVLLSGFGEAGEVGDCHVTGTARLPYSCMDEHGYDLMAGPETEQFAYASVVYYIERGAPPFDQVELEEMAARVQRRDMPPTQSLGAIGTVIDKARNMDFGSLAKLKEDVVATLQNADRMER